MTDHHSIWAIARNLVREIVRMRALMFMLVLLTASFTFLFAWWLHASPGRGDQKVQTFLSYSLSGLWAMLSLLTVFVGAGTIARDIKRKEIFTIATKPISRSGYLLGKFLGMALVNLLLLAVTSGAVYGIARVMRHTEPQNDFERDRMEELVFIARTEVLPQIDMVAVETEVKERVEKLVQQQINERPEFKNEPENLTAMRNSLAKDISKQVMLKKTAVSPGGHIVWHFKDVRPQTNQGNIYIRYKQDVSRNTDSLATSGKWMYGPMENVLYDGEPVVRYGEVIRTVHEFPIPASAVSASGDLYVSFENPPMANEGVSIIFPPDTGVQVLYVAGSFEMNFLRTLAVMYLRLIFLAILAMALGAWVSFPVAILVILVVYVFGIASGFIMGSLEFDASNTLALVNTMIMKFIPKLSLYDPIPEIEKGRLVSGDMLVDCMTFMVLFKGGIVALMGYLVFKFRELARVIV
ncbi:MAG: hypothetical protein K9M57_09410 [Phycisphaerae bacterium]|nr:hypothetical protein [Phycisphaerae bacterium]